ncbi:WD40 repeat-like protein [Suillus decipiens]|nr:WD40 repeat-like protein [Suillus decipiens]
MSAELSDVERDANPIVKERSTQPLIMLGHASSVLAAAFFKDGRRVVTSSSDKTLRIWDLQTGVLVGTPFKGHKGWVRSVAISPDDRRVASGGEDKTILFWNVENQQMILNPLVKHSRDVNSLCFSPDGKKLASGSSDCTVVVWDAETGTVLTTLHHDSLVLTVVFSPDGLKLASGSKDNTIRVWRTNDAEVLLEFNAHRDRVRSVVWSHDGQQLVSASYDQTVKFWNSSNADQIGQPCAGHTAWIYSLAISLDDSFVTTASCDDTVRLWSTKTHQQIGQALEHTTWIGCVAISPNGELLVSGGGDGKVRLWSIKNILEEYNAENRLKEELVETEQQRLPIIDVDALLTPSIPGIARSDIQQRNESSDNCDITNHHSLETHAASSTHSFPSTFNKLPMNTTVRNACIAGDLRTAEEILTQDINTDGDNCDSHASRSVIMARNLDWDQALRDAINSVAIQPSLVGCIAKGIALCGNGQLWNAMEAFDLAFTFATHDAMSINLLLLIKAIALFNAGHRDEAIRRVQDLVTTCQHLDTLPGSVVNSYLHVELATIAFENGQYIEAAEQFTEVVMTTMCGLSLRAALCEPRLKIFTVLFGWDLDSLWQAVHQRRCNAFLRADKVIEAVEAYEYMMRMIDEAEKTNCLGWSTSFKQDCIARCVAKGEEAVVTNEQARAIKIYSAGIRLDPSYSPLFVHRSKQNLRRNLYEEALSDAEQRFTGYVAMMKQS